MSEIGIKDQCFGVEVEMTGITRGQRLGGLPAGDRKSTRLNSSHIA